MRGHGHRMRRGGLLAVGLAGLAAVFCHTLLGDESPKWVTGGAFVKQLAQPAGPTGPTWSGTPLRDALGELARAKQVAIVLDRRVDPGQRLELSVENVPLEQVLRQIAANRGLGISIFEPVVYFGPKEAAGRLRTLIALRADDVERLAPGERRKFLATAPLRWGDFATPREVLGQMAEAAGIGVAEPDRVPHDLLAAVDLPPLNLVERLTLVLGQFGLTFEVLPDGRTVRLVPIPDDVALERAYPAGSDPNALARRLAELAPAARIEVAGEKLVVRGLIEDHERIAAPERPGTPPDTATGPKPKPVPIERIRIDSLKVQNTPLRKVLREVAGKLDLDFQIDDDALRRAGISLDRLVSFEVKNGTVDALLSRMLGPAGLTFERRDRTVVVRPARP